MFFKRAAVSVCALVAAMPGLAQGTIELEQITIEGEATDGFFGEAVATGTGTITKTGDAIAETPRSVSVVTEQQLQQRGARTVEDALKYTPGVTAGQWGLDARSDWSLVRGFTPRRCTMVCPPAMDTTTTPQARRSCAAVLVA